MAGTLYVFFGSGHMILAADVSDPSNPVEVGRLLVPGLVRGLFFRESDGLLFVANGDEGGLRIVEASDPSALVEIGGLDTPGEAYGVFASGSHAFVADGPSGLRIVDVSDPFNPVETGAQCTTCHSYDNVATLTLERGDTASMNHAYRLCVQCHFAQGESWANGAHGKRLVGWRGRRVVMGCTDCHSPHQPATERRIPYGGPALPGALGGSNE